MRAKTCSWSNTIPDNCLLGREATLSPMCGDQQMSPLAAHVALRSLKRATEKFYKVPTTALQSLYYGYEKVRIKQLLPQTQAVKFVYEVNFNKKQTVSVVYKQTQAVKTRECFVNTSPWARWSPGGKLPAVCSWLSRMQNVTSSSGQVKSKPVVLPKDGTVAKP